MHCILCGAVNFVDTFWGPIQADRYPCRAGYPFWSDKGMHVVVKV